MVKKIDIAISASILAYGLGCSVHDLKNRMFEQFDSEPPQPEWFGPLLIGLFYRRLNIHKSFTLNLS